MNDVSPPELRKNANFFERLDFLVKAVVWLIPEALNTQHELEHLMDDLTGLTQALADFKAEVATHAAKIDTELTQLLAAQGANNQPAIDAAAQAIRDSTAALQAQDVALDADDPAPPTP